MVHQDLWRDLPAAQQPDWPDPAALDAVRAELGTAVPLVVADECELLKRRLAAVAGERPSCSRAATAPRRSPR